MRNGYSSTTPSMCLRSQTRGTATNDESTNVFLCRVTEVGAVMVVVTVMILISALHAQISSPFCRGVVVQVVGGEEGREKVLHDVESSDIGVGGVGGIQVRLWDVVYDGGGVQVSLG